MFGESTQIHGVKSKINQSNKKMNNYQGAHFFFPYLFMLFSIYVSFFFAFRFAARNHG